MARRSPLRSGVVEDAAGRLLVASLERVLADDRAGVCITSLGHCRRLEFAQIGDGPHIHLQDEHIALTLEAVRDVRLLAKVAIVEVHSSRDLLRLRILRWSRSASEGREDLLVEAVRHDDIGLATGCPDAL